MNFLPKEWRTGDVITADSLDTLENGIFENSQSANELAKKIDGMVSSFRGQLTSVSEPSEKTFETGGIDPVTGEDDDTQTNAKRTAEISFSAGQLIAFTRGLSVESDEIKLFFYDASHNYQGFRVWKYGDKFQIQRNCRIRVVDEANTESVAAFYAVNYVYSFLTSRIIMIASDDSSVQCEITVDKKGEISATVI